jgi:hypothetical protein
VIEFLEPQRHGHNQEEQAQLEDDPKREHKPVDPVDLQRRADALEREPAKGLVAPKTYELCCAGLVPVARTLRSLHDI